MIIGIDVDDTLNKLSLQFEKYALQYNKEKNIKYEINQSAWEFEKAFGWNKENIEEFLKRYCEKMLIEADIKEDAEEILNKLKKEGNSIVIITARDVESCKSNNVYNITKKWLDMHNIPYDKIEISSSNKAQKCIENNVDLFIDDSFYHCSNVYEKVRIPVFMMDSIYNKEVKDDKIKRVFSWKEIYEEIKKQGF